MGVEKKSLISNMKATKKALIASNTTAASPLVSNKTASKRFTHVAANKAFVSANKKFAHHVVASKAGKKFVRE
jgi:hypothetical protein